MKNSLIACMMLCFGMAFGQLNVRNDAFVYVNDQVLFVTDEVNLQESTAKLYLRNEAQLLQNPSEALSLNSGLGELSVYQNSEVNHFAYHYWCSPVGGVLSSTSINNAFRVDQIDDPLLGTTNPIDSNNSLFTAGNEGTASPTLTISNRWLYTYVNGAAYSDWNYVGDANDITPGLGFTMKGMGAGGGINQYYDFRGKPNSGTITNSIGAGEFTLIGNPYPSALDAADFLWDPQNTNIDELDVPPPSTTGAIYYWEQDPANSTSHYLDTYVGGYASYTCTQPDGSDNIVESFAPAQFFFYLGDGSTASTPPTTSTTGRTARRYIPIGQGFMVEGATGIPSGTLVYVKNSHRDYVKETAANSEFFRSNGQQTSTNNPTNTQYDEHGNFIVPDAYKRFRLLVSFNELYSRELLANFHDSATLGFDYGLEAKRPSEVESDAYWTQNDEAFVIQANAFDTALRIPVVIEVSDQQPLSFGIYDIQNFDNDQGIYIYDAEYDLYLNLRDQNYHINIEPGNYTDRFEVVFTPNQALDIDEVDFTNLTINQNNNLQQLSIINPNGLDIKSIDVYDVAGKRLLQSQHATVLNRYELSTANLSEGVYIVNVTSNTNTVKSQKIIVKH